MRNLIVTNSEDEVSNSHRRQQYGRRSWNLGSSPARLSPLQSSLIKIFRTLLKTRLVNRALIGISGVNRRIDEFVKIKAPDGDVRKEETDRQKTINVKAFTTKGGDSHVQSRPPRRDGETPIPKDEDKSTEQQAVCTSKSPLESFTQQPHSSICIYATKPSSCT